MTKRLADVDLRETPTAAEIEATRVLLEQVTARLQVIFDDGMLVPSAPLLRGSTRCRRSPTGRGSHGGSSCLRTR